MLLFPSLPNHTYFLPFLSYTSLYLSLPNFTFTYLLILLPFITYLFLSPILTYIFLFLPFLALPYLTLPNCTSCISLPNHIPTFPYLIIPQRYLSLPNQTFYLSLHTTSSSHYLFLPNCTLPYLSLPNSKTPCLSLSNYIPTLPYLIIPYLTFPRLLTPHLTLIQQDRLGFFRCSSPLSSTSQTSL